MRWQEREAAAAFPRRATAASAGGAAAALSVAPAPEDAAELAGYRSVWDAPEVEFSPALEFLLARQRERVHDAGADAPG